MRMRIRNVRTYGFHHIYIPRGWSLNTLECGSLRSPIINKSQELTVFHGAQEIDFRYEIKARKAMVDLNFDALYS